MMTITRREALSIIAGGALSLTAATLLPNQIANAMTWSGIKSQTWDGITYSAQNGVEASGVSGRAQTIMTASSSIPAQKLCCVAKLTDGAGLIISSSTIRNSSATRSLTATATGSSSSGFQSRGHAYSLYSTHARYLYPAWPSARSAAHYAINENGQSFGTILQAPSPFALPTLIATRADTGEAGYCYCDDIYPLSLEHIDFEHNESIQVDVFESNGVNKIGIHTILLSQN